MHELGIVFYIVDDVKKVAEENHAEHVREVTMDIGEVSTVVPELLTDCWQWAANREEVLRGCKMVVNTLPAITHCDGCGQDYPTVQYGKTCPHCSSEDTWLKTGNEVEIKSITV